jgi:hypothetical protein
MNGMKRRFVENRPAGIEGPGVNRSRGEAVGIPTEPVLLLSTPSLGTEGVEEARSGRRRRSRCVANACVFLAPPEDEIGLDGKIQGALVSHGRA